MKIIVCVKWIISPDSAMRVQNSTLNERGAFHVVNPHDLVAVEGAVRLRGLEDDGEIILLCLGPPSAEEGLRRCFAIGADKGILLWDKAIESSDSYATALVLAKAIRHWHWEYDIILCGQKGGDMEIGQTGATLAEFLNIPLISSALEIEYTSDSKKVVVHRKLERGSRELVETDLPALITVETSLAKPRYPNLRAILAAKEKEVTYDNLKSLTLSWEDVGAKGSRTRIVTHSVPKPKPKKLFTPSSKLSAAERMRLIMTGGVNQKHDNLLEGEPEHIASNVARFMSQQKLLPD